MWGNFRVHHRSSAQRIIRRVPGGRVSRCDSRLVSAACLLDSASVSPRLGLFGGTFDPPHVGHLVTAVNVRHALKLDVVVLMVANVPWQKERSRQITPAEDRFALVEAAVADVEGLLAGRTEIDRGGASYTADTLRT